MTAYILPAMLKSLQAYESLNTNTQAALSKIIIQHNNKIIKYIGKDFEISSYSNSDQKRFVNCADKGLAVANYRLDLGCSYVLSITQLAGS
jgi:hypothetical protein